MVNLSISLTHISKYPQDITEQWYELRLEWGREGKIYPQQPIGINIGYAHLSSNSSPAINFQNMPIMLSTGT